MTCISAKTAPFLNDWGNIEFGQEELAFAFGIAAEAFNSKLTRGYFREPRSSQDGPGRSSQVKS